MTAPPPLHATEALEKSCRFLSSRLLQHDELATDVIRMEVAAIAEGASHRGIEQVAGGNTDVF